MKALLTLDYVADILCSVLFIEKKDEGLIKISFRSKGDFKVNIFASKYFNGGGHEHASVEFLD